MPPQKPLIFEKLDAFERRGSGAPPSPLSEGIYRAQVPDGWILLLKGEQPTLIFYPDQNHKWDGGSLE